MSTNKDEVTGLPDDLNPEIVKATAAFIGKITGLVPPPHDAFPPEWFGYLRTFTARLNEIARENAAPEAHAGTAQASEQATLAASAWSTSDTPISEALAYRDGFMAGLAARSGGDAAPLAVRDVLAERLRQVAAEGWTPEHDDGANDVAALADAAACYAQHAAQMLAGAYLTPCLEPALLWPWDASWWKPTTPRRDLVKAGALIIAELERIDRAATAASGGDQEVGS